MANHEDYLDALTTFARGGGSKEIPPVLEQYLNGIAKNGETLFQWPLLKPLIVGKIEQVIEELQQGLSSENIISRPNVENVRFEVMRTRIMDAVHRFTGAPFTIQRLCELLIDPRRHYKRSDKFMRGLEKNVLVVSTVDPFGRKVVSESGNKHSLVNGMDNGSPFFPSALSTSSLPPVPGWVTSSSSITSPSRPLSTSPHKDDTNEAEGTTNGAVHGVGASVGAPVFTDQGDQTPAVHAEEVVETAVSLEGDAGPEPTGAGEAMAEDEELGTELGTEDTTASTSSSSSSEDLSNSDTGEAASETCAASSVTAIVTSSSPSTVEVTGPSEARPWAEIASQGENKLDEAQSMDTSPSSKESTPDSAESMEVKSAESSSASIGVDRETSSSDVSEQVSTATSSHTEVSLEAHTAQHDDSTGFVPSAMEEMDHDGGQDISSSSSAATTEVVLTETATTEAAATDSNSTDTADSAGGESLSEQPRSSAVTSTDTSAASPSVLATAAGSPPAGKEVSSSDTHSSEGAELEGEPQPKHRKLSFEVAESDSSSSSQGPNLSNSAAQDIKPSSSVTEAAATDTTSTTPNTSTSTHSTDTPSTSSPPSSTSDCPPATTSPSCDSGSQADTTSVQSGPADPLPDHGAGGDGKTTSTPAHSEADNSAGGDGQSTTHSESSEAASGDKINPEEPSPADSVMGDCDSKGESALEGTQAESMSQD